MFDAKTLPCVKWEVAINHRKLSLVLCDNLNGWDGGGVGVEVGGRSKRKGIYIHIHIYIHTHTADALHCTAEANTAW